MADKKVVTARVEKGIAEEIQELNIPLSRVIEAGMNYFNKLDDYEKKVWLIENTPGIDDIVQQSDGKIPEELLELSLEKLISLITSSSSNFMSNLMLEMARSEEDNAPMAAGFAALTSVMAASNKLKEGIKSDKLRKIIEDAKDEEKKEK
ncbi:MAG: hypothetical protein ACQEQF_10500 [Bacillota bacterium]